MAPSLRTARASGRACSDTAGVAVRVGLTGPNRTRRELHSACSIALSSLTLLARPECLLPPVLSRVKGLLAQESLAPRGVWPSHRAGSVVASGEHCRVRGVRRAGCLHSLGLVVVLPGPVAVIFGGFLPSTVGPFRPLALLALAASPDKGPQARGCLRSVRAGLLPLRPHGRASLLADSEARPAAVTAPVARAAWNPQC
jgi:hypothetical protein